MKKWVNHLFVTVILIVLVLIINAKAFFNNEPNFFLYVYGITVTSIVFLTIGFGYFRYKDPSEEIRKDEKRDRSKPLVSCIFAVRNEEVMVKKCIRSLLNSSYRNIEVIIINDASTDKTTEVIDKFSKNPKVKIINLEKNIGKKRAIVEGIKVAKGEFYVFTDSDSVVRYDAIERIIEVMVNDKDVGAVGGHGRAYNSDQNILTKVQDSWYETQFSIKKALESSFGSVTCVSGPLAVFRKEAIYNYFPAWANDKFLGTEFRFATDRQLTGYVLGSKYIGDKLKEKYKDSEFVKDHNYPTKEWKVIYVKSAKVLTVVPSSFKKIIRQQIRWKKSFIRNLFFTGKFYYKKPIIPATKYYLGACFTIIGPFIAFRHLVYLPLSGNILSGIYYLGGIMFIGFIYGVAYKIENPESEKWIYRPLMSLFSTMILSWLIFYSIFTIKKMTWYRG